VRRSLAVGLVALAGLAAGCAGTRGAPAEPTSTTFAGPPPALPQAVVDTVLDLVTRVGGGATHTSARYAYGTRRQALRVLGMGDLPPNQVDSKVFVVVADGAFSLPDAKVRKGAPTPKGGHLTVLVDPDEPGNALDVAVSAAVPSLDRVGQVAAIELSSPTAPGSPAAPS
jgi:hypothetical protein